MTTRSRFCILSLALLASLGYDPAELAGQDQSLFNQLVAAGELPAAIGLANQTPRPADRDAMLAQIALQQQALGAYRAASQTASVLDDVGQQNQLLSGLSGFDALPGGQSGGITINDFQPLINLIQQTISPDSWSATGSGDGTVLPFLAGVWVDSEKALQRVRAVDPVGLDAIAAAARPARSPSPSAEMANPTRRVSLVQLELTARRCLLSGEPLPDDVRFPGGLYDLEAVVVLAEARDLLLVGKAGAWHRDAAGKAVNTATSRPLIQLDDLVVCWRAAQENGGRFGCSITPRKENLAAMQKFLATSPLKGDAWRKGLQSAVGQQDIEVFGIDARTHAARVLVDADHHMKLVGMGLEPSVPGVDSYFDQIVAGFTGQPMAMDVARWWFTLGEFSIGTNVDETVFALAGDTVRVLSETEFIDQQGERIHTGQSIGPTGAFARDFTKSFEAIADRYPVYRELQNVFELAVVCGLIHEHGLVERIDWDAGCFDAAFAVSSSEAAAGFPVWQVALSPAPATVDSVMNWHEAEERRDARRLKHTIAGVSGGVACDVRQQLRESGFESRSKTFSAGWAEPVNPAGSWSTGSDRTWADVR
jgi:Protein of unknown function (DUF1598)